MKRKARIAITSGLLAFSLVAAAASTIAWFGTKLAIDINEDVIGESNGAYFASGSGKSGDPFIINSPVHLYNLAWLQYLGYFNNNTLGAESGPTYFAIDEDLEGPLDMTGWILPPIGTTLNPFVGVFNGNGKTIANLTTINSSNITDYPKKPYPVRQAGVVSNVNVLGLFGVVGTCELTNTGVTPIYPAAGYAANAISNLYIDNEHVQNYQSSTLAGIAAGYVNAPLTGVGVLSSNSTTPSNIDLSGTQSAPTVFGGKTNISDFTSIGFCEDEYKTKALDEFVEIYDPSFSQNTSGFVAEQAGDVGGWGGSIGMDEIYARLETFRGSSTKTQVEIPAEVTGEVYYYYNGVEDPSKYREITTAAQTVNSYEYFDEDQPLQGRVVFGQSQGNYLWGKRNHDRDYTITREYHTDSDETCYYVQATNTDYYLYFTGGNASRTNNESQKTLLYEDADGWVYYKYNNRNYYLYASGTNNGTLRSSTTKQTYMFKYEGTGLRLYQVSNNTAQSRYVRYRNSNFSIGSSTSGITVTETTDFITETVVDHTIKHETHGSYLPLNVYKQESEITNAIRSKLPGENLIVNGAKLTNTGYIVGGTKDQTHDYGSGVRISNTYGYDDIATALGGSESYSGSNLQVLTRTKDSGGVVFIEDDFNEGVALSTELKNLTYAGDTKVSVEDLGLEKYESSRINLDKQFKANTSILYCMRFNEFDISLDNTITAEKVLLNGEVKENYVLPESCIDFNLKEKGYINFFGGGYRGGTCDAFFSLFHITRDTNDNITSLKRLSKIYGTNSPRDPYIYEYYDGTYSIYDKDSTSYHSTTLLDGYTMHFDMAWVEEPGFTAVDNTVWYFEIPVNAGEFALGSPINTRTQTGAYMFYLDVGANATKAYRSTVVELIHTIAREFSRPVGVAIVAGATSIDDANSYCITIKTQYNGVVSFARTSETAATYTESVSSASVYLSYAYDGLNVNTNEEPVAEQKIEQTIKRVTYFDYSASDNSTTKTVLSMVTTTTTIGGAAPRTDTSYETEQYTKYTAETGGIAVDPTGIIVYDDEGHIITSSTYANSTFFNGYTSPTSVYYTFLAEYEDYGTISAVITLTTNQKDTDTYTLYSPRGYSVTLFLTDDQDVTTDITSQCTLVAKDNHTYVVDQQTGKILLVINEEFIENDTSSQGDGN